MEGLQFDNKLTYRYHFLSELILICIQMMANELKYQWSMTSDLLTNATTDSTL